VFVQDFDQELQLGHDRFGHFTHRSLDEKKLYLSGY